MTTNDKLRDLLSRCRDIIGEYSPGHSVTLDELDAVLAEPTSPAPAAAPSEAKIDAWRKEITDYIRALLRDKPIPGRGADRLLDEAVGLMRRAATAPAASPPEQSTPIIATSATDGTVQEDHETDRQRHREPIPLPPAEDRQQAGKAQHGDGGVPPSRQDAARHVPGRPGSVHGADEVGGGAHVGEPGSGVRLPDGRLASPPVTDAEVEVAIELHADRWNSHGYLDGKALIGVLKKKREEAEAGSANLRTLIARRVQQAGAAAEELARAADAYVSLPAEHFQIRGTLFRDLCTALAAFRAAQGGAS